LTRERFRRKCTHKFQTNTIRRDRISSRIDSNILLTSCQNVRMNISHSEHNRNRRSPSSYAASCVLAVRSTLRSPVINGRHLFVFFSKPFIVHRPRSLASPFTELILQLLEQRAAPPFAEAVRQPAVHHLRSPSRTLFCRPLSRVE
jgi:hypothetical protein